jgi:hypothetical protein
MDKTCITVYTVKVIICLRENCTQFKFNRRTHSQRVVNVAAGFQCQRKSALKSR